MNAELKMITVEQLKKASDKNEERLALRDALHFLGKLEDNDAITIIIPIDGDDVQEVSVGKAEDPVLFKAIGDHIVKSTEKIEAEILALGVKPSDWTPPEDDSDEADDDGDEQ